VILTGFLPPDYMPQAYLLGDIFVAPSQNEEGLGMVFLEAAASGLPLIGTRLGGIPEVVQEGVNGLLVDRPHDPEELAGKILTLLENPDLRQRLGRQGREQVCQNFSWEHIAQAQEAVYDKILERTLGRGVQGASGPARSPQTPPPTL
jgi:spore coat protein SA